MFLEAVENKVNKDHLHQTEIKLEPNDKLLQQTDLTSNSLKSLQSFNKNGMQNTSNFWNKVFFFMLRIFKMKSSNVYLVSWKNINILIDSFLLLEIPKRVIDLAKASYFCNIHINAN